MAELTVRDDKLVVTVEPREKRALTWFGLRKSTSTLLDGLELRVPLAKVVGVHVGDAYWELPEQMDARDTTWAVVTKGANQLSGPQRWTGIFHVMQDGVEQKKLCFIDGEHSKVVAVDLDKDDKAPFTQLVVTCEWTSDSAAASIKAAAGLT